MVDGLNFTLYEKPHLYMSQVYESLLPPPPDEMADAEQKFGITLWPRETLKTSMGCQGLAEFFALAWKVRYGYDGRVLIVRSAREASQSVLTAIREDLSTGNPVLQRAFGDLSYESPQWNLEGATFNWRSTNYREPTFDTAATGVTRTGFHYDLIIVDDIANETNYESEVEMVKARRYITALVPVLAAWGSLIVIGTRWGIHDPYGAILADIDRRRADKLPEGWKSWVGGIRNKDGTLFYPSYLTESRLEAKKRTMYMLTGSDKLYTASYLNVITTDESAVFKKSEQVFYTAEYYPRGDMPAILEMQSGPCEGAVIPVSCVMHVDPATSTTAKANRTGIAVVMTDHARNRWVQETWGGKELPADIVSRIVSMARHHVPDTVCIDVLGQQVLWVDRIRSALDEAGLHDVTITQYKGRATDSSGAGRGPLAKEKRIESLGLLLREGSIFFHEGTTRDALHEMDYYNGVTSSNHYDVLDALAQTLHLSKAPKIGAFYNQTMEEAEWDEEFGQEFGEEIPNRGPKGHGHTGLSQAHR